MLWENFKDIFHICVHYSETLSDRKIHLHYFNKETFPLPSPSLHTQLHLGKNFLKKLYFFQNNSGMCIL